MNFKASFIETIGPQSVDRQSSSTDLIAGALEQVDLAECSLEILTEYNNKFRRLGLKQKACEVSLKMVEVFPRDEKGYIRGSEDLQALGQHEEAIDLLLNLGNNLPRTYSLMCALNNCFRKALRSKEACDVSSKMVSDYPEKKDSYLRYSRDLISIKQPDQALPVIDMCIKRHGLDVSLCLLKAEIYKANRNLTEYEKTLEVALSLNSCHPQACFQMAVLCLDAHKAYMRDHRVHWHNKKQGKENITGCVHLRKAASLVQGGIDANPRHKELLILGVEIERIRGDDAGALDFALRLVDSFPSFWGSHARACEQYIFMNMLDDALKAIEHGLSCIPDQYNLLVLGMRVADRLGSADLSSYYLERLTHCYPDDELTCSRQIINLIELSQFAKARHLCDDLAERISNQTILSRIYSNVRNAYLKLGMREEARSTTQLLIANDPTSWHPYECRIMDSLSLNDLADAEVALVEGIGKANPLASDVSGAYNAISILRSSNLNRKHVSSSSASHCDVICIAAQEAPYIADFIHHYLYLGFSNIFIGINNTSDSSLQIIGKIQDNFENVRSYNIDSIQNSRYQLGSYSFLYNRMIESSVSSHYLIVDIDEFWIADPFPTSIGHFLSVNKSFDTCAFQWLQCYESSEFLKPLDISSYYVPDNHVKSITSASSLVLDTGIHAPSLASVKPCGLKLIKGNKDCPNSFQYEDMGVRVADADIDSMSKLSSQNLGWVLHRFQRSEVEYCSRLLLPCPNSDRNSKFKVGRLGYLGNPYGSYAKDKFLRRLIPPEQVIKYHNSLEAFYAKCRITGLVSEAQRNLKDNLSEQLLRITPGDAVRHSGIWRRTFRGTSYIELLERKARIYEQ